MRATPSDSFINLQIRPHNLVGPGDLGPAASAVPSVAGPGPAPTMGERDASDLARQRHGAGGRRLAGRGHRGPRGRPEPPASPSSASASPAPSHAAGRPVARASAARRPGSTRGRTSSWRSRIWPGGSGRCSTTRPAWRATTPAGPGRGGPARDAVRPAGQRRLRPDDRVRRAADPEPGDRALQRRQFRRRGRPAAGDDRGPSADDPAVRARPGRRRPRRRARRRSPSTRQPPAPRRPGVPSLVVDLATGQHASAGSAGRPSTPTLFAFAGDAYLNELGVTTPLLPAENCPQGNCALLAANPAPTNPNDPDNSAVQALADFITFLAPPPRGPVGPIEQAGEALFAAIGCADCHRPTWQTGPSPIRGPEQRRRSRPTPTSCCTTWGRWATASPRTRPARPRSGRRRCGASGSSRPCSTTAGPPRSQPAILPHDGQGLAARNRFAALSRQQQAQLIAFLNSL